MNGQKEKHLEFIQGVINRHNSNSFMIKGWTISIATAVGALAGALKDPIIAIIAVGPIAMFWILDSVYLANERCFISLYSEVANPTGHRNLTGYTMDFKQFRDIKRNNWYHVLFSRTIIWFYIVLISLSALLSSSLKGIGDKTQETQMINVKATISTDTLKVKTDNPEIINKIYINELLTNPDSSKITK